MNDANGIVPANGIVHSDCKVSLCTVIVKCLCRPLEEDDFDLW